MHLDWQGPAAPGSAENVHPCEPTDFYVVRRVESVASSGFRFEGRVRTIMREPPNQIANTMKEANLELISLCHQILEDRTLTDQEVRLLHDWLHAHPDSWKEWPASLLIEPVHAVLEDDQLNVHDLNRVANALFAIESEWSARLAEEIVEEAIHRFDTRLPQMPAVNVVVTVPGGTGEEQFEVDLSEHRCTCAEWTANRKSRAPGHIGRCCNHVARAFLTVSNRRGWPDWFQALIDDCELRGRGTQPEDDWAIVTIQSRNILVSSGQSGWSNVFAPARSGKYQRFGYNWSARRWSYGIVPPNAETISAALHQHFGY